MGEVVALRSSAGRPAAEPPHRRLRRGAGLLAGAILVLSIAILLVTVAALTLGLAFDGAFLSMDATSTYLGPAPDGSGIIPFATLPTLTRAAYAATFALTMAPALFVLVNLRGLMRQLADGWLLGPDNGRRVTRIAVGLAGYAFAPFFGHQLVVLAGHGVDQAWFHASEFHALVLAAVLLVVAQVMDAAHEAEQDRDGFV